jgi:signal transduction histidine kinase
VIPVLTVRTKVALAYTLVFGVIFAGFSFLVYRNSREASLARLDASIVTYAGKLEAEVEEQSAERLFPAPAEFRSLSPGDLAGQHFVLRSLDGRVVIDDSLLAAARSSAGPVTTGPEGRLETLFLRGESYRVYTGPVEVDDTTAFLLTVAAPMTAVESGLERLRILFLFSVPAVLILAAIAAYLITRAAFSPVSSMISTARRISADNLGARLMLPRTSDEVRLLGETLNGMMDRIENAFRAQRQFIADAAHEIRTPLTILRSDLELLRKRAKSGPRTREIGAILAEVDRLARMAENLLLLSRLDAAPASLENEPVRIDEVIVQCVRDMNPLFRNKGVVLRLHIGEAMEIRGDMEGMKRIVLNLLENSLKFTKRGGRVSVSLGNEPGAEMPVVVTVQDTGCGIAPRDLPRIFGRFFRAGETRGDGGGSGLGLAIVEHLVKLHKGIISVESDSGKGTTFALRFPVL